ncbi:MAG: hypothetical protein AB7S26_00785 [Sandaracinaceae bacterium]
MMRILHNTARSSTARLTASFGVLTALCLSCGAGESGDETTSSTAAQDTAAEQALERAGVQGAIAEPPCEWILGCWNGPTTFYECFREGGQYVYGESAEQPGHVPVRRRRSDRDHGPRSSRDVDGGR